jgi:uncharacterized repeat protein (TIGR01451 family)
MSFFQEHKWSILIAIIAALVIAIVAVLVFHKPASTAPAQSTVTVDIQAPQQAGSGTQVVYQVTVTNNSGNGIRNVTMDMIYPTGFVFQTANPTPSQLSGGEFTIPDLASGQNAAIMIKGTLSGNTGETKQVSAVLHYSFESFNSQYTSNGSARTQITNSSVGLSIDGPTSTSSTQSVSYTVTYTNTTSTAMQNLELVTTIPQDFVIDSTSPSLDADGRLAIPTLAANQSGTLTINGRFSKASSGASETFAMEIDGANATTGQSLAVANATYPVSIIQAPLQLTATVQDNSSESSNASNVVNPGDTLSYAINYQNSGSVAATNVVITATIAGSAVNLSSVQAQKASIHNNVITWNGSQNAGFASLAPQASGNLTMQFQISNPATKDSTKNLQAQVIFQITSQEYPQGFQLQTPAQKIQTQLSLLASASRSSGANPPMVNATSTYDITYTIHNASNDVTGGSVAIALPEAQGFDMTSVNPDQAANVKYNSSTHILTWTISNVPAYSGVFVTAPKLQFSETIEPSITDTGSDITLTQNAMFSGTDAYTSQQITAGAQDLTTSDAGVSSVIGAQ